MSAVIPARATGAEYVNGILLGPLTRTDGVMTAATFAVLMLLIRLYGEYGTPRFGASYRLPHRKTVASQGYNLRHGR